MTITIGEYTTRKGCRAIVEFEDLCSGIELLRGFVILPGGLTKVCVWWDLDGRVRFPAGYWHYRDFAWTFVDKENRFPCLIYSDVSHAMLDLAPSPFDITEPKQMKEETKPTIVQKQRLIKLTDNCWIKPDEILSISAHKKHNGTTLPDRVTINYAGELYSTINCDTFEEAQKLADDLAEKVNSIK